MPEIVAQTTEELRKFLEPYLGRKDYGNLRYPRHGFPMGLGDEIDWVVTYEPIGSSTSEARLSFYEGRWLFNMLDQSTRESAVQAFRGHVERIHGERTERLRKWFVDGWNIQDLIKISAGDLNRYHTKEELELIEEFSKND